MSASLFNSGGYIGAPVPYNDGTVRKTLTYVGGQVSTGLGTTGNITLNYALTGGLSATPQDGDFVIVAFAASVGTGGVTLSYRISGYTQQADLFSNDTEDAELQVGTKFMTSTPDTSVTITSGSGNAAHAYGIAVQVWRNVDTGTPMDTAATTATGIDSLLVNPAAITPVTSGAQIVIAGAGAHTGTTDTYTASYLSNFVTGGANDSDDVSIGLGNVAWTSGAYDGAAWTCTEVSAVAHSWASATLALRPALQAVQSGIFNLDAVLDFKV